MSHNERPLISVILPCYNEQALLRANTTEIVDYLTTLEGQYRWEILIINDGSADSTGDIAEELATEFPQIRTLHHPTNFGVGQALRFGFSNTRADYVITLDVDLSYDVQHIGEMLTQLKNTHAKMVLASPYMEGGTVSNVPFVRRILSVMGNRFLKFFVRGEYSTITSLVRAYDGPFIRSLDLRSVGLDLMPEILHKSLVMNAKVIECPGRLDWGPQLEYSDSRVSSIRLIKHIGSTIKSGFALRPVYFLLVPGIAAGIFTLYMLILSGLAITRATAGAGTESVLGFAGSMSLAFQSSPHIFILALFSAVLSIQFLAFGALASQNTRHFEDLFSQNSKKLKSLQKDVLELKQ